MKALHRPSGRSALRVVVEDYGWIHLAIGMAGNALFVLGSVAFLPGARGLLWPLGPGAPEWQTVGVWLFIAGSTLMFIGSLGELAVSLYNRRKRRQR